MLQRSTQSILGVLTHTTAWNRHWGGNETLKLVLVYVQRCLAFSLLMSYCMYLGFSSSHGLQKSGGTQECIFFTLNTYQATFVSVTL